MWNFSTIPHTLPLTDRLDRTLLQRFLPGFLCENR